MPEGSLVPCGVEEVAGSGQFTQHVRLSSIIEAPDSAKITQLLGSFARTMHKSVRGRVIRTGPGKRDENGERRPMEVQAGDVVWWGPYIDAEDGDLVLISEQDVRVIEA